MATWVVASCNGLEVGHSDCNCLKGGDCIQNDVDQWWRKTINLYCPLKQHVAGRRLKDTVKAGILHSLLKDADCPQGCALSTPFPDHLTDTEQRH